MVFFTDRFIDGSRAWFRQVTSTGGWRGGWLRGFSSLQQADNPFGSSPWRHETGALWDIGPHALSTLGAALGPVVSLRAVGGERDLVTLVLRHESGASSTVSLTLFAPPAAAGFEAVVWGEAGLLPMPLRPEGEPSHSLRHGRRRAGRLGGERRTTPGRRRVRHPGRRAPRGCPGPAGRRLIRPVSTGRGRGSRSSIRRVLITGDWNSQVNGESAADGGAHDGGGDADVLGGQAAEQGSDRTDAVVDGRVRAGDAGAHRVLGDGGRTLLLLMS